MSDIELLQGDCLELMKDIPDKSIDMILCDLPYGTTACKWDTVIPFEPLWKEYKRIIRDKGVICLFGSEPFSSKLRISNLDNYRYDWIWVKEKPSNFQLMNYQAGRLTENIMIFSKGKCCYVKNNNNAVYYPQRIQRDKPRTANVKIYGETDKNILNSYNKGKEDNYKTYTDKLPTNVLYYSNERHKVHPTQKPVELLEYLIKTYTLETETVLDNCMGSGSTGVACVNLGRRFIGVELNESYFNIAKARIEEAQDKLERK